MADSIAGKPSEFAMQRQMMAFERQLKLFESQLDNLREHLEFIDKDLVEKHRAALDQIKSVTDELEAFKSESDNIKKSLARVSDRTSSFASRDSVKVLEKYINLWEPLNYVTREEVEKIIGNGERRKAGRPRKSA